MKVVYNRIIPFKGFLAINLFGILFVRKNKDGSNPKLSDKLYNHEAIHTAQMKEMLYVFFYIWYFIEWLIKLVLPPYNSAYKDISFEREAKENQNNLNYLNIRKKYSWINKVLKYGKTF